mmetsp:Transcript_75937/g.236391  ORF Transcript_75937/g.236391 Transcript_75937/m.236391 type:complete len:487 (-) Transcript_75937:135-1595(-)
MHARARARLRSCAHARDAGARPSPRVLPQGLRHLAVRRADAIVGRGASASRHACGFSALRPPGRRGAGNFSSPSWRPAGGGTAGPRRVATGGFNDTRIEEAVSLGAHCPGSLQQGPLRGPALEELRLPGRALRRPHGRQLHLVDRGALVQLHLDAGHRRGSGIAAALLAVEAGCIGGLEALDKPAGPDRPHLGNAEIEGGRRVDLLLNQRAEARVQVPQDLGQRQVVLVGAEGLLDLPRDVECAHVCRDGDEGGKPGEEEGLDDHGCDQGCRHHVDKQQDDGHLRVREGERDVPHLTHVVQVHNAPIQVAKCHRQDGRLHRERAGVLSLDDGLLQPLHKHLALIAGTPQKDEAVLVHVTHVEDLHVRVVLRELLNRRAVQHAHEASRRVLELDHICRLASIGRAKREQAADGVEPPPPQLVHQSGRLPIARVRLVDAENDERPQDEAVTRPSRHEGGPGLIDAGAWKSVDAHRKQTCRKGPDQGLR